MAFQVGNKEADVSVEFPNLTGTANSADVGDPASRMPVTPDTPPKDDRDESLGDWAYRRSDERDVEHQQFDRNIQYHYPNNSIHEVPDADFWKGHEMVQKGIPDYSKYAEAQTGTIPDYSHLEAESPKGQAYDTAIKQAEEMQKNIWNDPQFYPLIKQFMQTGDPIDAFKAAAAITMLTFGAAPKGSVGSAGGKPPYFRKGANDNPPGIEPGGKLPSPDPYMINPAAEALYGSEAVKQRMQQQVQAIRQKAIETGSIEDRGSIVKEMESTLDRLIKDYVGAKSGGLLTKGDLADMQKEIASVQEMLSVFKSKSGSVVPIDHKEMMATKPQEPQGKAPTPEAYLSTKNVDLIKKMHTDGYSAKEIAAEIQGYYKTRVVTESQITQKLKDLGLVNMRGMTTTVAKEIQAYDIPILGANQPTEMIVAAIQKKYPDVKVEDIITEIYRHRNTRDFKKLSGEGKTLNEDIGAPGASTKGPSKDPNQLELDIRLRKKYERAPENISRKPEYSSRGKRILKAPEENIFTPKPQGNLDFLAPEKPTLPIPDLQQAKREMKFAQDTFAKFNQKITKEGNPSKEVLEENRLRGMLYDRAKDLHATVQQIEKDAKSGSVLGRHAREYLESRVQAYMEQIQDLKGKIWGSGPNSVGAAKTPTELIHFRESPSARPPEGLERSGRADPNKGAGYQMGMTVGGVKLGQLQVTRLQEMIANGDTAQIIVDKMKRRHGINLKRLAVEAAMDRLK